MRFHLVDRVDEVWRWTRITGVKCVSLSDDVFDEHFPGYPVFPGSLILEGLAQLSGSLFEMALRDIGSKDAHAPHVVVKRAALSIVREFKIRRPTVPGDRLNYEAEVLAMREDFGVTRVAATRDGELCAKGELVFSFVVIDDANASDRVTKSRLELYDIVTRDTRFHDAVVGDGQECRRTVP